MTSYETKIDITGYKHKVLKLGFVEGKIDWLKRNWLSIPIALAGLGLLLLSRMG